MSRPVEVGITRPFSYHKQEKLFSKYELSTFISGTDLDSWTALFPVALQQLFESQSFNYYGKSCGKTAWLSHFQGVRKPKSYQLAMQNPVVMRQTP